MTARDIRPIKFKARFLKRQLTGLIKAARPEPLDREKKTASGAIEQRPASTLGATTGRETIEPHRHVLAYPRPGYSGPEAYMRGGGGWLGQGPRGRRCQVLGRQGNLAARPLLGHAARSSAPVPRRIALPASSPFRRGFFSKRQVGLYAGERRYRETLMGTVIPNEKQADVARHPVGKVNNPRRKMETLRLQILAPSQIDLGGFATQRRRPAGSGTLIARPPSLHTWLGKRKSRNSFSPCSAAVRAS